MKNVIYCVFFTFVASTVFSTINLSTILSTSTYTEHAAYAEDNVAAMGKIRQSFADLMPYLADSMSFEANENRAKVLKLLTDLRDNFHSVDNLKSELNKAPGFKINLSIVTDMLSDVTARYGEGKTSYALWRARGISSNCISCHAQYHISVAYSGDEQLKHLGYFAKGEYFLATRQLAKALVEFKAVINDPDSAPRYMDALRRLLIIFVRLSSSPNEALKYFEDTIKRIRLPLVEETEVKKWIDSLKRWNGEKVKPVEPVARASELISGAVAKKDGFFIDADEVSLLRATAMLHAALSEQLSAEKRSKALFLVGYSYTMLPLFYINELPEIYLEQCIVEFPGSEDAKKAFRAYKNKIVLDYSGIAGSDIPAEVNARLNELHKKAYGIPSAVNRIF